MMAGAWRSKAWNCTQAVRKEKDKRSRMKAGAFKGEQEE
jgi:hypothetical protein